MIIYRKTPHLRLQRVPIPEPPYWAATIIAPYSARRAEPIAIDYLELQATRAERFEVAVCDDVRDELERAAERTRVREPVLIDATESAEVVFRRGEEALEFCAENDNAAILLVSSRGVLPDGSPDGVLPVTRRKLPMLMAARSAPVGASSAMIWGEGVTGMADGFRMVGLVRG